jgi:Tfp pilus assembly protein PilF
MVLFASGQKEEGLGRVARRRRPPGPDREARGHSWSVSAGARELLAEALLETGQHAAALREFEAVQQTEPRRFRAVAGAARAAEQAGDREAARRHYAALLEIAPNADARRPELAQARTFVGTR